MINVATGQPTELADGDWLGGLSAADFGSDGLLYGASVNTLYRDISLLDGSFASSVDLTLDGEAFFPTIQSIVAYPTGGLLASASLSPTFGPRTYTFNSTLGRIEFEGLSPGPGNATEASTGWTYYFDNLGVIYYVEDEELNSLGAIDPTAPTLEGGHFPTGPFRDLLFDIDLATGEASNLRDVVGNLPQGLVFAPEPHTGLLVVAGLVALALGRSKR